MTSDLSSDPTSAAAPSFKGSDGKPFDASFGASERYTPPHGEDARTRVQVGGDVCDGEILGRNGPRVQVRFTRSGSTYVRWFDADALVG